jgi:hypothetical protein
MKRLLLVFCLLVIVSMGMFAEAPGAMFLGKWSATTNETTVDILMNQRETTTKTTTIEIKQGKTGYVVLIGNGVKVDEYPAYFDKAQGVLWVSQSMTSFYCLDQDGSLVTPAGLKLAPAGEDKTK